MKIVHIIASLGYGGAEREVARLAIQLREAGDQCEVVCICEEGYMASAVRVKGVPVVSLECGKRPGLIGMARLTSYLCSTKPQIAHSHLISWAPICGRLARIPAVIVTEHGLSLWKSATRIKFDRMTARFTDKIVVVAEAIREARIKRWKFPAEKMTLIPNGIDLSRFNIEVDAAEIKSNLGFGPTDKLVVTVGHLTAVKGHKYLLQAAAIVIKKMPMVRFALVGNGPLLEELVSIAREYGIGERVKFLGYRQDVEAIIKSSDVFVVSSLREGTSIAILEAMSAGVPVVATAVGGNPEVIEDGKSGLLVPAKNPDALARAILKVLSQSEIAAAFSLAAKKRVETEYSAEINVARHRQMYMNVLGGII